MSIIIIIYDLDIIPKWVYNNNFSPCNLYMNKCDEIDIGNIK